MDRWTKRCRVTERALPLSSLLRRLAKRLVLLFIQLPAPREIVLARLLASQECVRRRARWNLITYPRIHRSCSTSVTFLRSRENVYSQCDLTLYTCKRSTILSFTRHRSLQRISIPIPRELMVIYSPTSKSYVFGVCLHIVREVWRGLLVTRLRVI